jgi:phage-related protein
LDLLEEFGIKVGPPKVEKVRGTELWELRILGKDNIRIFYVTKTGQSFLLLHGFIKKKQKTGTREIKTALERLKDYYLRSH